MKGDDCPFDHQLSKYPCDNYVKGFCSRGDACMFSHKVLSCSVPFESFNVLKYCTLFVQEHIEVFFHVYLLLFFSLKKTK
jgi:hypothetical protein